MAENWGGFLSFSRLLIFNLKVSGFHRCQRKEEFFVTITFKVKYCYRWEQKDFLLQDRDPALHIWSLHHGWQRGLGPSEALSQKIYQHKEIIGRVLHGQM